MDDRQIWRIALEQSAIDSSCQPEDFLAGEPRVVRSKPDPKARAYLDLPFGCDLTSYGSNVVASVGPAAEAASRRYVEAYPAEHCFETPHLHVLEGELRQLGLSICHMAEYFLPDLQRMERLTCPYETRLLEAGQLAELYQPQWGNALCEKRKHLDQLAVGAFHRGELVGLAGCSARIPGAGHRRRSDQPTGPCRFPAGESALLLCGLVQHKVGAQRAALWIQTGVGAADGKTGGSSGKSQPEGWGRKGAGAWNCLSGRRNWRPASPCWMSSTSPSCGR